MQSANIEKDRRGRRDLNSRVLVPDVGEALRFSSSRTVRHQLCQRSGSFSAGVSSTHIAPTVKHQSVIIQLIVLWQLTRSMSFIIGGGRSDIYAMLYIYGYGVLV